MTISKIVKLFRAAGYPEFKDGRFSATLTSDGSTLELLQDIRAAFPSGFKEIAVDGIGIVLEEEFPGNSKQISFTFSPPTSSDKRFYSSIDDLLKKSSISKGKFPEEFYIVDEDYASDDEASNPRIEKLIRIARAIQLLSKLANYHDEKSDGDHYKLVFLYTDKDSFSPATVLETIVTKEMLDCPEIETAFLEGLCSEDAATNPHYSTHIGVFAVTIAEYLRSKPQNQAFLHLILNWKEFLNLYQNNHATFLSGFAFHRAKKEVAEAELQLAEHFTRIVNDITGKLLSIPLSFVAAIVIAGSDTFTKSFLTVCGLLLATVLISETINHQKFQLDMVKDAKELIFNGFEGRKESYPEELRKNIDTIEGSFDKKQEYLTSLLFILHKLAWLPLLTGFIIHSWNYYNYLIRGDWQARLALAFIILITACFIIKKTNRQKSVKLNAKSGKNGKNR